MLQPSAVWLAVEAVDMRLGMDGLSLRIQQALGRAPCDGTAYAFSNRRHTRLKLLCWDGNGVWLCQRRLHRGHFVWLQVGDAVCEITAAQWQYLIAGIDWQRVSVPSPAPAPWRR
jgi:transposase